MPAISLTLNVNTKATSVAKSPEQTNKSPSSNPPTPDLLARFCTGGKILGCGVLSGLGFVAGFAAFVLSVPIGATALLVTGSRNLGSALSFLLPSLLTGLAFDAAESAVALYKGTTRPDCFCNTKHFLQ